MLRRNLLTLNHNQKSLSLNVEPKQEQAGSKKRGSAWQVRLEAETNVVRETEVQTTSFSQEGRAQEPYPITTQSLGSKLAEVGGRVKYRCS